MYVSLIMDEKAETCSSAEDYERVCESDGLSTRNNITQRDATLQTDIYKTCHHATPRR
jgi:hypothetical protein